MRIRNSSSFSRDKIAEIIRFVKPPGVSGFDVWVKAGTTKGRAYIGGSEYRSTKANFQNTAAKRTKSTPYCVVSIDKRPDRPGKKWQHWAAGKGYLEVTAYTREEALVYLLAHELRHLWQGRVKRGHRVWGARGQYSERDASAYGLAMLRKWRRR
jgi:hypothetical protein